METINIIKSFDTNQVKEEYNKLKRIKEYYIKELARITIEMESFESILTKEELEEAIIPTIYTEKVA